jgi:hypothetical protein
VIVVAALGFLVASITVATYIPNQIIQNVVATNSTTTTKSSSSPYTNLGNITLGNPQVNYTEYDKTTSSKPAVVNGTHGIQISFTGHGILNGINTTDNGNVFVTNGTGGVIYSDGDGKLVSKNGGKLRYTGTIFQDHRHLKATGNLAFLNNTVDIYKMK